MEVGWTTPGFADPSRLGVGITSAWLGWRATVTGLMVNALVAALLLEAISRGRVALLQSTRKCQSAWHLASHDAMSAIRVRDMVPDCAILSVL